jgi:hypothetical protein
LFALAAAILCMGTPAHAGGIGLRWGSCEGTANRSFACDRSTGSELLVGSFEPPSGIQISGMQAYLRITAGTGTVPSWWQLYAPGSCRRGSISASFDVSDQTECDDPYSGQAAGGSGVPGTGTGGGAKYASNTPGNLDVWLVAGVPSTALQSVQSGRRYAAFKVLINHQKSNGVGACSGCGYAGVHLVRGVAPRAACADRSQQPRVRETYTESRERPGWAAGAARDVAGRQQYDQLRRRHVQALHLGESEPVQVEVS